MKPLIDKIGSDGSKHARGSNDGSPDATFFFWKDFGRKCNACAQFTRQAKSCNETTYGILRNICYHSIEYSGNRIKKDRSKQDTFSSFFIAHNPPDDSSEQNADHLDAEDIFSAGKNIIS